MEEEKEIKQETKEEEKGQETEELKKALEEKDQKIKELEEKLNQTIQYLQALQQQAQQPQGPQQPQERSREDEVDDFDVSYLTDEEKKLAMAYKKLHTKINKIEKMLSDIDALKQSLNQFTPIAAEVQAEKLIKQIREKTFAELEKHYKGTIPAPLRKDVEDALAAAKEAYKNGLITAPPEEVSRQFVKAAIDKWEGYGSAYKQWEEEQKKKTPPAGSGEGGTEPYKLGRFSGEFGKVFAKLFRREQ